MKKIRIGMFETNSSMVHAITVCTPKEWDMFEDGELLWHPFSEKLVKDVPVFDFDEDYYNFDRYTDLGEYYELFNEKQKLSDGRDVVVFGYYGHD